MAETKKIGLREVSAIPPDTIIWDAAVSGFGIRRQRGPGVSYVLFFRTSEGRQRWMTIGRHGQPWTPDLARKEALRILASVISGADPAADKKAKREAASVADLCDQYLKAAESGRLLTRLGTVKKASTLDTDRGRIEGHIKPLLGARKVAAVTRDDIETFLHAVASGSTAKRVKSKKKHGVSNVRGGRGTASRTVGLLGAIFAFAVRHRMRSDNPVHGVQRFADGRKERRLSDVEYSALGDALRKATGQIWPPAIAAARFLALTGWRSGEALALEWDQIDFKRRTASLPDTKTGRSVRALSHAAIDVLVALPRSGKLAFPATRGEGRMQGFPKLWARIAKLTSLSSEITPHVLRHSFASLASDLGYAEATVGTLIGHRGSSVTSRYTHSADAVLLSAADAVARQTAKLMGDVDAPDVVVKLRAFDQ